GLQVVRVLFLDGQDPLQHAPRGGIIVTDEVNHLGIGLDRDAFGHQVLADHVGHVGALGVFGVAARRQALGIEVRVAVQLNDACRDLIGVALFLGRVLGELGGNGVSVN